MLVVYKGRISKKNESAMIFMFHNLIRFFRRKTIIKMFKQIKNTYNSLSKPAKASLWFIICYVIQRGLQFIGMPIYTRIMSTEEYGVYSVFLSWFNLICVFSSLNIYSGTFNKAMIKYEENRDKYISSVQYLTFLTGIGLSVIILLLRNAIYNSLGYSLKFQLLFCIHLTLFPSLQYWSQKQRFLFEYKKLVLVTLLNSIASLTLGIGFVLISTEKSFALVEVTVLAQAFINVVLFISLAKKGCIFYSKEYWRWSTVTALPLIPHYLSEILLGHADRLMISQMCGASQAGIYNIVYQISMVMTILRTGINGSFTPWLYYSLKGQKFAEIRQVTKLITVFMWILTVLFMLTGPEVLKMVAPFSYYEAIIAIPAIMIGCFFIFVYVLFLNVEIYYEQNQYVAIASIVAVIVNVILNCVCIKRFGYLAAGYTTMASYILMAILHYIFLRRIMHQHSELKLIFDVKFILLVSIALMILGVLIIKLYEYTLLRLMLICVLLFLIVIKRKYLNGLFKKLKNRT